MINLGGDRSAGRCSDAPLACCAMRARSTRPIWVASDLVYRERVGETYSATWNPAHQWHDAPRDEAGPGIAAEDRRHQDRRARAVYAAHLVHRPDHPARRLPRESIVSCAPSSSTRTGDGRTAFSDTWPRRTPPGRAPGWMPASCRLPDRLRKAVDPAHLAPGQRDRFRGVWMAPGPLRQCQQAGDDECRDHRRSKRPAKRKPAVADVGLSRKSPTVAPSGRVRMKGATFKTAARATCWCSK